MRLISLPRGRRRRGFTLIEVIGVLAVISLLAGLLVPRVFSVISSAKVSSAALAVNGLKSAAMMYYGKYGKFGNTNGVAFASTNLPFANWDSGVLMREGFIEKPLGTPIGTSTAVQVVAAASTATVPDGSNAAYNLDGNSVYPNDAGVGAVVLQVTFNGVGLDEARELNRSIDGETSVLGEASAGTDILGRVKYVFASGAQTGNVLCYLAHR